MIKSENYSYSNLNKTLRALCHEYPFFKTFAIGKSVRGLDIKGIKIGAGRESVLYAAAFHGSEHITTNITLFFLEALGKSIKKGEKLCGVDLKRILAKRSILILPRINPDGCDISILGEKGCVGKEKEIGNLCQGNLKNWNSNFRGVDINHNFNADWEDLRKREEKAGICGPSPTRYGGRTPESEPETKALCDLCRRANICHALALHSQGEVIYHGYKNIHPKKSKRMAEILATESGYALDVPMGLASGGGFKDWFILEFDRPAFTVEVGKGKNPLPINTAEEIYKKIEKMLTVAMGL